MNYNALMIAFCFMFCVLIALYAWHYLMDEAREAFEKWERIVYDMRLRLDELGKFTNESLKPLAINESSLMETLSKEELPPAKADIQSEMEYVYQTDIHAEQAVEGLEETRDRLYQPLVFVLLIWLYMSGQITPSETTAETEFNPA